MRREKKTILVRHRDITPPGSQRVNITHLCRKQSKECEGNKVSTDGRREDRPLMQKEFVYQARRGTLIHVARFIHEVVSNLTFKV